MEWHDWLIDIDGDGFIDDMDGDDRNGTELLGDTTIGDTAAEPARNLPAPSGEEIGNAIIGHARAVINNPVLEQDGNEITKRILNNIDATTHGVAEAPVGDSTGESPASVENNSGLLSTGNSAGSSSHELYFSGGCDCGYNPRTCGAGHFCRWQYS